MPVTWWGCQAGAQVGINRLPAVLCSRGNDREPAWVNRLVFVKGLAEGQEARAEGLGFCQAGRFLVQIWETTMEAGPAAKCPK